MDSTGMVIKQVPIDAVGLSQLASGVDVPGVPTLLILCGGDWLQMLRIDTATYSTEMVNL
jgi:hypothetical protein